MTTLFYLTNEGVNQYQNFLFSAQILLQITLTTAVASCSSLVARSRSRCLPCVPGKTATWACGNGSRPSLEGECLESSCIHAWPRASSWLQHWPRRLKPPVCVDTSLQTGKPRGAFAATTEAPAGDQFGSRLTY